MPARTTSFPATTVAVIGFGETGQAVARVAREYGVSVIAIDDFPSDDAVVYAEELAIDLYIAPTTQQISDVVNQCELVVVSPGIPPSHPVFALASKDQLVSEIELAYRMCEVPMIAITGTNGKTSVTELVAQMMNYSGIASAAAGNIGPTLIEAACRPDLDRIVAEVSSFQLSLCSKFQPHVGTWLNFAEDHLDWHPTLGDYAAAKARIWQAQGTEDIAVVNRHDPIVMEAVRTVRSRVVTFGHDDADYIARDGRFIGPGGSDLGGVELLTRALPHDVENATAALATALEAGASVEGCQHALQDNRVLPHRVELVAKVNHIGFYDDSKATTPSAVIAALGAFSSVVLIAGGKNKGLDLDAIGRYVDQRPELKLRATVAIGDASPEIQQVFAHRCQVVVAGSMEEAVYGAFELAEAGDVVLLSPGCASFDWYRSYAERGDAFAASVRRLVCRVSASTNSKVCL